MSIVAYLDAVHADHERLGYRSGNCTRCLPVAWHERARVNALPAYVVGGTPLGPDSRSGEHRHAGSPRPVDPVSASPRADRPALAASRSG